MGSMNQKINEIFLTKLKIIPTEGGNVLHALKNDDENYKGFGELYFSTINYGFIKAWKKHLKMTMNIIVPVGEVKFVFYSESENKFLTIKIGESNYQRITVQPGVWFGFQGISPNKSLVLNFSNIQHDPNEVIRKNVNELNFDWSLI
jgi:dTDP-4-dehydrorhamnose 3,5-epimerase